jgi:hypothetical protein
MIKGAEGLDLPYGLRPLDFFRTVEDVQNLLGDLNNMLFEKHYGSLINLVDRAAFSGLISRTVVERLARSSRRLVVNRHHNGYPDLILEGSHPRNAVARGTEGLEVKASRKSSGWQSHGPRAGWFCVAQFFLDERDDVAADALEPVSMRAIMVARLEEADWSWQPAAAGRIRSGTASIRPSGLQKMRAGAIWVEPSYQGAFFRRSSRSQTP